MTGSAAAGRLRLLSIVIPARNEAGCIRAIVELLHRELQSLGIPHEILVVDDGSTDRTANILEELRVEIPVLHPLRNPHPPGFGAAVVCGFENMAGDAAVIVMADGSDAAADVVRYWIELNRGFDCVFGSRFLQAGDSAEYPRFRLLLNRLANRFLGVLHGIAYDDITNAFKGYRRTVLETCRPLRSRSFDLTVELPLLAVRRGFSWTVVPVRWGERHCGASKFRLGRLFVPYLVAGLRARFAGRRR